MRVTRHQPIPMSDGLVRRADVYRAVDDGRYPVILTHGIYAKGLAYQAMVTRRVWLAERRPGARAVSRYGP